MRTDPAEPSGTVPNVIQHVVSSTPATHYGTHAVLSASPHTPSRPADHMACMTSSAGDSAVPLSSQLKTRSTTSRTALAPPLSI